MKSWIAIFAILSFHALASIKIYSPNGLKESYTSNTNAPLLLIKRLNRQANKA